MAGSRVCACSPRRSRRLYTVYVYNNFPCMLLHIHVFITIPDVCRYRYTLCALYICAILAYMTRLVIQTSQWRPVVSRQSVRGNMCETDEPTKQKKFKRTVSRKKKMHHGLSVFRERARAYIKGAIEEFMHLFFSTGSGRNSFWSRNNIVFRCIRQFHGDWRFSGIERRHFRFGK